MATLYLHCAICGRKQAGGLLSAAAWGETPLPPGTTSSHPAATSSSIRVCPSCVSRDADWPATARTAAGIA